MRVQQAPRPGANDHGKMFRQRQYKSRKDGTRLQKQNPLLREGDTSPELMPEDDAVLVSRTAAGDRNAYAVLVRRHLPRVMAVTRRMLGDDANAEEAAQETLLRLWTHAGSYKPNIARLTTWLTRIAANICLDRLRKREEESWPENFDMALLPGQEQEVMDSQVAARVNVALQKLPERQRLALILCHYQEMSMAEAANIMETSPEAIESLLSRARRGLKRMLETEWRGLLAGDSGV